MDRPRRRLSSASRPASTLPRVGGMVESGHPRQTRQTRTTDTSRQTHRKLPAIRRRIGVVLAFIFVLWWLLSPVKKIDLGVNGEGDTRGAIDQYFSTSTNRNLLINSSALESVLEHSLTYATDVRVDHDILLSRLTVRVSRDTPALRWQSRGVQYTLSRQGIALYQTPASGEQNLPLVLDTAALPVDLKTKVVPADFVNYLLSLEEAASQTKLHITERRVREATREIEIKLAKRTYRVILSTQAKAAEQLRALELLERRFTREGRHPQSYVDLRIPNRAYWK